MAEPADMVLLREMRGNVGLHERTRFIEALLDQRFGSVEAARKSFRHAAKADALLTRLVARDVETRIGTLEQKVRELESQK